jgi:hypothetical protein
MYAVTHWTLTNKLDIERGLPDRLRQLDISLQPIGDAMPLRISGWAGMNLLKLRLETQYWQRDFTCCRDSEFIARMDRMRSALEDSDSEDTTLNTSESR